MCLALAGAVGAGLGRKSAGASFIPGVNLPGIDLPNVTPLLVIGGLGVAGFIAYKAVK